MAAPELRTIRQLIDARAVTDPSATYFIAPHTGRSLTFSELRDSCVRVSAMLAARGLQPGDHVSLVLGNGIQTIRLLLGAMYGGYCVHPVNLLSQPEQMRYVIEHADARVVFAAPEWVERVRDLTATIARPIEVVAVDPDGAALPGEDARSPACEPPIDPAPDALALLMYTSGTTGKPKGVMLTQANLAANALAISREHRLGSSDRVAAVLPLYHINAFAVTMLAPLAHGGSLVMPPKFSAAGFWEMAIEHGCTWLNVVPTIVSYLLEGAVPARDGCRAFAFAVRRRLHCLRNTIARSKRSSASASSKRWASPKPWRRRFRIRSNRNCARSARSGAPRAATRASSIATGAELADGTVGEIVIRGPQVTPGYYKNPDATAAAFFPGHWLRTGDLGYRDADGFFFVTGRIKELIIKGGENIAPREIDEALLRHPAVLDAAAVGIPDRHYGQDIMACVIVRDGQRCSEQELRDFCSRELGRYKTPKVIRFVDDLPRGPSGKVQRLKLADLAPDSAAA